VRPFQRELYLRAALATLLHTQEKRIGVLLTGHYAIADIGMAALEPQDRWLYDVLSAYGLGLRVRSVLFMSEIHGARPGGNYLGLDDSRAYNYVFEFSDADIVKLQPLPSTPASLLRKRSYSAYGCYHNSLSKLTWRHLQPGDYFAAHSGLPFVRHSPSDAGRTATDPLLRRRLSYHFEEEDEGVPYEVPARVEVEACAFFCAALIVELSTPWARRRAVIAARRRLKPADLAGFGAST
jgi:hypothetical protein